VYKEIIRENIPKAVPFYPLGMPDVTDPVKPIALGIRSPDRCFLAIWRIDGNSEVGIQSTSALPEILYPVDAGITIRHSGRDCAVIFPRPRMGCILSW
jgi:alpha-galactosidase